MKILNGVITDSDADAGKAANVRSFGAKGDGVANDTSAIQAAINSAPVIRFPSGTYLCNSLIVPSGKAIYGEGDVVLVPTITSNHSLILRGNNIIVSNLTVRGSTGTEWGVTLDLRTQDYENIRIEDCTFSNLYRSIRIRSTVELERTVRNLWIRRCIFKDIGERAIDLLVSNQGPGFSYSLQDIHIEDNHFEDIAPDSSNKEGDTGGNFDGAIYIGSLESVDGFHLLNNVVRRAAPQFLAMSLTTKLRRDFIVSGNIVKQEGTQVVPNMCYTFHNIDNLVFSENACDYVDYEHVVLRNCRNFKVVKSHFSRANVGIAIHDRSATERSYGRISDCDFVDIECPTSYNNGNKGIFVVSDKLSLGIHNCHFVKQSGSKVQVGVEFNYFTIPAPSPRWGIQIDGCQFEQITGIVVKSGGSSSAPGHARILSSTFRSCPQAISFTHSIASLVYACVFDDCDKDVYVRGNATAFRAQNNLHTNTNPDDAVSSAAYIFDMEAERSLYQVDGCTFRNVKSVLLFTEPGRLSYPDRILIWANHDIDSLSTGLPPLDAAVVGAL